VIAGDAVFPLCTFYTQDARSQKRSFLPSHIYAGVITRYRQDPVEPRGLTFLKKSDFLPDGSPRAA